MPGGLPLGIDLCNTADVGTVPASTALTSVTSNASSGVFGTWTQLIAATASDCCWITVTLQSGQGQAMYYNIGVGSAGNEVVVSQLVFPRPTAGVSQPISHFSFSLAIPAGSRVSAQSASSAGGASTNIGLWISDGAFTSPEGMAGSDRLGVDPTSASAGVSLTPATNAKGSYVQVVASTARDYAALGVVVSETAGGFGCMTDVSIGAGGSEVVLIPNIYQFRNTQNALLQVYHVSVPAGTRIAVRGAVSSGTAAYSVALIGIYR